MFVDPEKEDHSFVLLIKSVIDGPIKLSDDINKLLFSDLWSIYEDKVKTQFE